MRCSKAMLFAPVLWLVGACTDAVDTDNPGDTDAGDPLVGLPVADPPPPPPPEPRIHVSPYAAPIAAEMAPLGRPPRLRGDQPLLDRFGYRFGSRGRNVRAPVK